MRVRRAARAASIACLTAGLVAGGASESRADPSATDIAAARALGVQGVELADQHKCEEAVERLARAERLFHAPTILGRLAECQIELGHVVAGTEALRRLLREPLPPRPPPAFVFARARAEKALAAAEPKIAQLVITVIAPSSARATVTVDDETVSPALLGVERPTDPGDRVVKVNAPGYAESSVTVSLGPGERRTLSMALGAADASIVNPAPPPPAVLPEPEPPSRTGAVVAFSIGGAGLVAAGVLGGMWLSSDDGKAHGSDVTTLRAGAGASLALGLTSAAVGIVLLATGGGQPLAVSSLGSALGPSGIRF